MTEPLNDLDALLRSAAEADPAPVDLEARVRHAVHRADQSRRRRRTVITTLGTAGSAIAASTAFLMLPRPSPPAIAPTDANTVAIAPEAVATPAPAMRGTDLDPASADVRILETGGAAPVVLATTDPDITIVWMLPPSATATSEIN
jgi:hypothetical protein